MTTRALKMRESTKTHRPAVRRPPFECVALLLQGGGALGAYQAGVYEALTEADLQPDWVAGISVGAINAALIAGNPPETRVAQLRAFWEAVTGDANWGLMGDFRAALTKGHDARRFSNRISAASAMVDGVPGFFAPRLPAPWLQPAGCLEATSFYETSQLRTTIERLVDFDRINAGEPRFSIGAVNVRSGNFVYFDTRTHRIRPEHVLASGALPPGFPAIEIEGEFYWDGGLVSNTPLQWVLEFGPRQDTLAFQVDLWSSRGDFPRDLSEVAVRQKEIQFSSRTRANTDQFKNMQRMRSAMASVLAKLPKQLKATPEAALLSTMADRKVYNIVQLIYHAARYEGDSKDYEFSRASMEAHWRAGYHDAVRTLRQPNVLERPDNLEGVSTFDIAEDGRE